MYNVFGKRFQKVLIWTLILVVAIINFFGLTAPIKTARAQEINFDFSKEEWKLIPSGDQGKRVIDHTVPMSTGSTRTTEYQFLNNGTMAYNIQIPSDRNIINEPVYKSADIYRVGTSLNYFLVVTGNSVFGLYYREDMTGKTCNYDKPKLAFWSKPNAEGEPDYCFAPSDIPNPDSEYSWYIKKTSEYLIGLDDNAKPQLTTAPVNTQDCSKLFLASPPKTQIDQIFKQMDPNNTLGFANGSPLLPQEEQDIYDKYYRSPTVSNYSDRHFLTDSGYRIFVGDYQAAEEALAGYWTDVASSKGSAETTALVTAAGAKGISILGSSVANLALKIPSAPGAAAVFDAGAATEAYGAAAFWPLAIIAGTIAVSSEGIAAFKGSENENARRKLAGLIEAAFYVPAHLQFHECMMNNNDPNFTKKDYEEEVKNWSMAFKLIISEVDKFVSAEQQASGEGTCLTGSGGGLINTLKDVANPLYWLARALCSILQIIGWIADWLTSHLFYTVFNAYHPPPTQIAALSIFTNPFKISSAHAAPDTTNDVSPLNKAFTVDGGGWSWVIPAWKWSLGLIDLFLVVILLFLGIVNILHIQYDTYNLKKALPLLIVGVLLANFSLLIMRMLIDAANILTHSFMGGLDPGKMVSDLIGRVDINKNSVFQLDNIGVLLIAIVFGLFAMAGFLILGFMFYMRYAAVILLGIVAPIAFVFMAFPPTQSIFKQWWSWTVKMIFMKPLAFFLLYLALKIKEGTATSSLTGWIIITFIVYMAILIPWKLGGALASFWGGVGGTVFGTKKGGWARKPVDEWWQRRKDQAGAMVKMRAKGLFRGAQADRDITEAMKKKAMADIGIDARKHDPNVSYWQKEGEHAENSLKALIDRQMTQLEEGKYKINIFASLIAGGITGAGSAAFHKEKYAETEKELILAAKDREANKNGVIIQKLIKEGKLNEELTDREKEMLANGQGVKSKVLTKNGRLEVEVDEDGKEKLMTEREARELASVIRLRALGLKDDDPAKANLERSAFELEADAAQFQQANQHYTDANGVRKPMQYDKFMDKRLSGRIISIITPLLMEEIQVNMLNENFKSMQKRMKEVIGFKNFRANGNIQHLIVQGKFSQIDPMQAMVGVAELQTRLGFIGKKGDRNRALHLWDFLNTFDSGETFGKENAGRMLRGLTAKSEEIVNGSTGDALAEAVLNARARGSDIKGFEKIAPGIRGNAREMKERFIDEMKKQKIDPKKLMAEHPEILQQFDMTNVPQNRAQIRWVNNVAEVMQEISMTTGAGNPTLYTLKTKDTPSEKLWEELEKPYNPTTLEQAIDRSEQSEAAAQRDAQQIDHMASTPTEQLAEEHGGYQRAYQSLEASPDSPALTLGTKLNGLSQLVNVDIDTFRTQVAQVIANSLATTFAGLENELLNTPALQNANVLVDLTELKKHDSPENVTLFREDVRKTTEATTRLQEVREGAAAEEILHSVPGVQQNLDLGAVEAAIGRLENASNNFASALGKVNKGEAPSVPPEVYHELLQTMSSIQPIVPLTKNMLEGDESKAGDVAAKILVKLKAFAEMKRGGEAETPDNTLKAILKQMKGLDQNLRQIASKPGVIKAESNSGTTPSQGGETAAGGGQAGGQAGGAATNQENPPYTPNEEMPPEE